MTISGVAEKKHGCPVPEKMKYASILFICTHGGYNESRDTTADARVRTIHWLQSASRLGMAPAQEDHRRKRNGRLRAYQTPGTALRCYWPAPFATQF
jgi:hypothetical protein